jgi:diguanylate cyclase (GGDEF)-like protein
MLVSSILNNAISRGVRGIFYSLLASAAGALATGLVVGWSFSPDTDLTTTLLCATSMGAYLLAVGALSHQRNRRLHDIRLRLQAGELALNDANQALQRQLSEIHSLQERLSEQAVRDPLTNLHNRRFLDTTMERELARCKRDGHPLCLILIDIDHFKQINDKYGHQAGDEVIKGVAHMLTEHARASDVACRYGGEEFLMLLPNMPPFIAYARAEQWRKAFSEHVTVFGDFHIKSTLSIGVANFPDHGSSPEDLFRSADLAMYQAKTSGRNRVVTFTATRAVPLGSDV